MVEGQGEPVHCPRCGGLMIKLGGSPFYWHADNNHPRCDITNIVDPTLTVQTSEKLSRQVPPKEPSKGEHPRK